MALQRQNISISLGQGLDTKTDPKQVVQGKLLTLQNGVFKTPQEISKLPGNNQIGTTVSNGNAIATYNNELEVFDGKSLYSFSSTQNQFNNKGTKSAVDLSTQAIVRNIYQQTSPDFTYHPSGFLVSAWNDSSGGVRYSVFDSVTNQGIVSNALLSSTAINPKVLSLGAYAIIVYIEGNPSAPVLKYVSINSATLTVISAPVTLLSMASGSIIYDAEIIGTAAYFIAQASSTVYKVFSLSSTLVLSSMLSVTDSLTAAFIFGDGSNNVWFGGSQESGGNGQVFVNIYNSTLATQLLVKTIVEAIAGNPVIPNVTGIVVGSTGTFFYELENADGDSFDEYVRTNTVSFAGSVGSAHDFNRSVGLASKPFVQAGTIYVTVVHDSKLQQTYFVIDQNDNIVVKIAPGDGGGLYKTGLLPEVVSPVSGVFEFAYLNKDLLTSIEGNVFTQTGVSLAILTFAEPIETENLGNNLNISGGVLSMYDGANLVEQNFHVFPEDLSTTLVYAGGGLSIGTYQYVAVWEWTDNQGQLHQSAPSVPVTVDNTGDQLIFSATTSTTPQGSLALGLLSHIVFPSTPDGSLTEVIYSQPLVAGMLLTSAGNLTVPTYVVSPGPLLYYGPFYPGANTYDRVLTNVVATANTVGAVVSATPNFNFTVNTTIGSTNVQVPSQDQYGTWIFDAVAGSADFVCANTTGLGIGFSLGNVVIGSPVSGIVGAINGNVVSLIESNGGGGTQPDPSTFTASALAASGQFEITGTFTPTSATATGVELGFTGSGIGPQASGLYVGQTVYDSGNVTFTTSPCKITAITATTVTFSSTVASVGVSVPKIAFGYAGWSAVRLQAGTKIQTSDSTTLPPGTIIKSISIPAKTSNTLPVIVVDTAATASQTAMSATTADTTAVRVQIPTLRLTNKTGNAPVVIAIYRTTANGTNFFKVSSITNPLINSTTVDSLGFYDTLADAEIIGNQELYTTGGEVDNSAMPATSILTIYKNRLLGVPSESPDSWWYSKQVVPGTPVQFSAFFVQNVDSRGGPLTALGVMDDKLILFKKNNIFYVVGDGPSPNGTNNDFSEGTLISTDIGCVNKRSVVAMSQGLMFQSSNGIYLLDRSLGTQYIGNPVESFNNAVITSASLVPGVTQVRFTLDTGVELIYDYFVNQWSERLNVNAADSTIFEGLFTYVTPGGIVNKETPGAYTDNGAVVPISFTTSWLSFAGLQGFQRAYKLEILGEWKSPHTLTINVAYDFNSTPTQTTVIPVLTDPGVYQFRVFLQRQKCEAVQFTVTESQVPSFGQGLSISSLGLEVGAKVGLDKLKNAVTYD